MNGEVVSVEPAHMEVWVWDLKNVSKGKGWPTGLAWRPNRYLEIEVSIKFGFHSGFGNNTINIILK